jgi:hypothetical protein
MLKHSRRRALGLLIAAGIGIRLVPGASRALAAGEAEEPETTEDMEEAEEAESDEVECYDSKDFGPWKAQASDRSAGARLGEVPVLNPKACDLTIELQVNTDFDAKIFITGNPDELPEDFLIKPENRLIAKTAAGKVTVDEQLCGNCTDIYDDQVSVVLPLATAPLFRDEDSVELVIRLAGKEADCRFKVDTVTLRKALDWADERRDALAKERDDDKCVSPEGCFITTACCEVLGLGDDCFELRALRRYRDAVLAKQPGGLSDIARYYAQAPRILAGLSTQTRETRLLSVYARFVLPAALAARLGLNRLAYRLYVRMLDELAPDILTGAEQAPRPLR